MLKIGICLYINALICISRVQTYTNPNGVHIKKLEFFQCNEQCAQKDGQSCWGPGPEECVSCKKYKLDNYCIDNCTSINLPGLPSTVLAFEADNRTCKRCHQECLLGCTGTEARDCWECKTVSDGLYCVSECPSNKYNNNGICEECHKSCVDGCTGPSDKFGPGGCNSCGKFVLTLSNNIQSTSESKTNQQVAYGAVEQNLFQAHCIGQDEPCPDGFYQEYLGRHVEGLFNSSYGKPVCRKCHHRCTSCTAMGTHISVCECAKYEAGEQCEDYCPRDYFPDEQRRHCVKCSPECNGCFGPTEADCINCRVYRIYHNSQPSTSSESAMLVIEDQSSPVDTSSKQPGIKFNCTAHCPPDKPHRISESNTADPYCSEVPGIENPHIMLNMSSTYILIAVILSISVMACRFVYRCQLEKQKDKTMKLSMLLTGNEDVEPLTPSNVKPNLSTMQSIKETELRIGRQLGEGFGGKVFQGFWHPEESEKWKCRGKPLPVAIKVLRDNGQSNINKDFLNEAYMMATLNHPNLVSLMAICNTSKNLMLITPLMPFGCLLEYVRLHKNEIGAKNLLEWCKQIARGMAYLEEKGVVHRDLALRNVLLQTPCKALISDFGLAKLLDLGQSEYHGGGRFPIKWLAPECILERKFTHKSDVWAFGVTVWELLTFGGRPFDEYNIQDVPLAIEKGARLPQPKYMSAEVYKVIYACWFYNADDRPDFKDLAQNFVKFARDPERYLICKTKGIDYSLKQQQAAQLAATLKLGGSRKPSWSACWVGQLGAGETEYISADEALSSDDDINSPMTAPISAQPDLTPSTHNRLNEMFRFDMHRNQPTHTSQYIASDHDLLHNKEQHEFADNNDINRHHHHHHQLIHHQHTHHQLADINNNNLMPTDDNANYRPLSMNPRLNSDCTHWPMKSTFSTHSLSKSHFFNNNSKSIAYKLY